MNRLTFEWEKDLAMMNFLIQNMIFNLYTDAKLD